jgi:hypothetical protein
MERTREWRACDLHLVPCRELGPVVVYAYAAEKSYLGHVLQGGQGGGLQELIIVIQR